MFNASLTRQLLFLIAAVTIPFTCIETVLFYQQYRIEREKAETSLVEHAGTIAQLVDREIERTQAVAEATAVSSALRQGDMTAFRDELIATTQVLDADLPAGAQPFRMGLIDRDGNWINDTDLPSDNPVRFKIPNDLQAAITTGRPQVSNLYDGSATHTPRISISVPVFPNDMTGARPRSAVAAVGIAISRQRFVDIVAGLHLPKGVLASIQDRTGVTIARSFRDEETVGKLPMPIVLATIMSHRSGLAPRHTRTLEGTPSAIAFAHAPVSGFIVKVDVPEAILLAPLRASLLRSAVISVGGIALGIVLAILLARQVAHALRRIVPAAQSAAAAGLMPVALGLRDADAVAAELTHVLIDNRTVVTALTESKERLRTLADAMPQLVWAAGPDGECDYFNAQCYAFTGASAGSLSRRMWLTLVHPDDRVAFESGWDQARRTGKPYETEYRGRRRDGAYRWMLFRAVPVHGPTTSLCLDGAVTRWFGSSTDITDIMDARQVLARSKAELETLVEQRTTELRDLQRRLAQTARMDALGQLAGGIAHDFNNVLQSILGSSALIERRPDNVAFVTRFARLILESAERGAGITQRLLAFSRRTALRIEPVDIGAVLPEMQEILTHTLGAGIVTQINVATGLPMIATDRGQLETVIINLATNARDAMDGAGLITISARRETVRDGARTHAADLSAGSYICIEVTDTGTGMDAALIERVLEPFFTTKPVGQGTGLGLSMAHGFAAQSGGGLHIESTPGAGTSVRLWLPATAHARPAATYPAAVPSPGEAAGARILIVDDVSAIRHVLATALKDEGFHVRTADSAEAALTILANTPVDLLISDFSMPDTDGIALIAHAQKRHPHLPAILITGHVESDARLNLTGACDATFSVMLKPFSTDQLVRRSIEMLDETCAMEAM